jgi:hypothetical protein
MAMCFAQRLTGLVEVMSDVKDRRRSIELSWE